MNRSEFERAIGSHLELLAKVPETGVHAYDSNYVQTAPSHSLRSKASLIHDHMIECADSILPREDFKRIDSKQRILYNFQNKLLIQFNKLDPDIRRATRNHTTQSLLFDEGETDGLEGIPANLPLLTAGYVMRPGKLEAEGLYIAKLLGDSLEWVIRLDQEDGGQGGNFPTPIPHDPQPIITTGRIKRPVREQTDKRDGTNQP